MQVFDSVGLGESWRSSISKVLGNANTAGPQITFWIARSCYGSQTLLNTDSHGELPSDSQSLTPADYDSIGVERISQFPTSSPWWRRFPDHTFWLDLFQHNWTVADPNKGKAKVHCASKHNTNKKCSPLRSQSMPRAQWGIRSTTHYPSPPQPQMLYRN